MITANTFRSLALTGLVALAGCKTTIPSPIHLKNSGDACSAIIDYRNSLANSNIPEEYHAEATYLLFRGVSLNKIENLCDNGEFENYSKRFIRRLL